ncbi:hypothetical protein ABZ366_11785 [Streptomyces sp. NPDC005904]|uniref:hypothetical protein n=1 Tax=Streptomyces sp. NPDC005904 TaxID=3154570 RepID=UPI0033FC97D7
MTTAYLGIKAVSNTAQVLTLAQGQSSDPDEGLSNSPSNPMTDGPETGTTAEAEEATRTHPTTRDPAVTPKTQN